VPQATRHARHVPVRGVIPSGPRSITIMSAGIRACKNAVQGSCTRSLLSCGSQAGKRSAGTTVDMTREPSRGFHAEYVPAHAAAAVAVRVRACSRAVCTALTLATPMSMLQKASSARNMADSGAQRMPRVTAVLRATRSVLQAMGGMASEKSLLGPQEYGAASPRRVVAS
jgi:hypothetical protein